MPLDPRPAALGSSAAPTGEASPRWTRSDEAIARYRAKVDELEPVVGDPEDVPDASGSLPADRRFTTLYYYRQHRIDEVTALRAKLPELEASIKSADDRTERSTLRAERDIKKARLEKLLAIPGDMAHQTRALGSQTVVEMPGEWG